jgi:hypothetical protein
MTSASSPQASADRLAEIAEILATGLMRGLARKSSGKKGLFGESSLDLSAFKSSDPTPTSDGG